MLSYLPLSYFFSHSEARLYIPYHEEERTRRRRSCNCTCCSCIINRTSFSRLSFVFLPVVTFSRSPLPYRSASSILVGTLYASNGTRNAILPVYIARNSWNRREERGASVDFLGASSAEFVETRNGVRTARRMVVNLKLKEDTRNSIRWDIRYSREY